ncbi:hypothetical protein HanPSC8_Chr09g0359671 [Helianthus annuus]|nr:hypothetical protein HanPSC8_Chr09g0359671 [Helianthus annuus]
MMVPTVQNVAKTTIQVPRFGVGTNSRNHDENTCPHPKPAPMKQRRINNKV